MNVLRVGSRGSTVRAMQANLKELGYYIGRLDGDFGPLTRKAVEMFQREHFVTGIADNALLALILDAANKVDSEYPPVPKNEAEVVRIFGKIVYSEAGGGRIRITNKWARQHIIRPELPIVGRHNIHRKIEPIIRKVLLDIQAAGLEDEIRQFGCWAPRHKMHNSKRSLSLHSWAIAFDVNWATNPPGSEGDIHPGIVDAFERHNFTWGGRWRWRDDMHFQYAT